RANKERACDGMEVYRKKMGSKYDMLFRDTAREYGDSETGSKYDGDNGTKVLNEGYLHCRVLPKTLKYALDSLYTFDRLEMIGYVHVGLFCQVLRVDRPTAYVTRVTMIVRSEVSNFDTSVLPAIYKSYVVHEIVHSVQKM
ncbi:hypothetical protein BD770DRAFT_324909, partial [Pilaira anomala]